MCAPLLRRVIVLVTSICAAACGDETPPTAPTPQPAILSQLSLTPTTVSAGTPSEGRVILAAPAPANGAEVRLSSSDGVALVPASVMVPAGAVSVPFTVTTRLVAADTNATISGLLSDVRRDVVLRVVAPFPRPPTLRALEIDPSVFKGGENTRGTIKLTGPTLGNMTVFVSSRNPLATPPPTVIVRTQDTTATFTIATSRVTRDTAFEIVATLGDQTRAVEIRLTR